MGSAPGFEPKKNKDDSEGNPAEAVVIDGLATNMVRQVAGVYNATKVLGFLVEAAPTADDTAITPVNGVATTAINKEAFTEGQVYPIAASAITVGTGGEFLLFIPA